MPGRRRALRYLSVGEGRTLVLLHGFAMQPRTYLPLAHLLADRIRVVIPDLFDRRARWDFDEMVTSLVSTFDELGLDQVSMLGHSFGGGLELGLAARNPARVVECVFSDTLGIRDRFRLAAEATRHPLGFFRLATPPATRAFVRTLTAHPVRMAEAGWWGFQNDRTPEIEKCAEAGIPCHVLWAARDTLLARSDGEEFARRLHATFAVADAPPGYGPIDHDWMFDDAELFASYLDRLGLQVFGDRPEPVWAQPATDAGALP